MRIRALPVVVRAVRDGVQDGLMQALEEGKKPENEGNPDILRDTVASAVLNHLMFAIDFSEDLKATTFPNEFQEEQPPQQ